MLFYLLRIATWAYPALILLSVSKASKRLASAVLSQALKAADVRGMSIEDIDKQVKDTKMELFNLRLAQATRQVMRSGSN